MASQTLHGLAIRQAEMVSTTEHNRLPNINESFGPGDGLGIHMDQRLPSISDLLRGVPPLSIQPQYYPTLPPSPLPSPIRASPSLFSNWYPNWSGLPPRPRSVSGHYPGSLPPPQSLGPRRASTDCINAGTRTTTSSVSTYHHHHHHQRVSPDRDHNRQRRSSKAAARRQRNSTSTSPSSSFSTPYYNYPSDSEPTHPSSSTTLSTAASTPPTSPEPSSPTQRHTQQHQQHQQQPPKKEKRNNAPYTFEQEAFFIYHRIDLDLPWEQVRAAYMARWPGLKRTVSGLECAYYRTNANIPAVAADGLAVLVDLDVETEDGVVGVTATGVAGAGGASVGVGVGVGGSVSEVAMGGCQGQGQGPYRGSSGAENDGEEKKIGGDAWYKYYKGVAYRTRKVPCRKGRYSLMERFPEELVDERHDWVREEHRVMARGVAERRRRQREEFIATKARRNQQSMFYL